MSLGILGSSLSILNLLGFLAQHNNMYLFILQGMSSKVAALEEELAKAASDLEQEKAATLAQTEEIDTLKKVSNIIDTETCITDFFYSMM